MRIISSFLCMLVLILSMVPSVVFADETTLPAEEPTETTESIEVQESELCELYIDNTHVYDYMTQSYSQGYEPQISGDYAVIVLPLSCTGNLISNQLRATVDLGDVSISPFEIKNYEQTVYSGVHTASDGSQNNIFLVQFWLEMSPNRINGTYPVTVTVKGEGTEAMFTIYVNITDGIDPNTEPTEPYVEPPTDEPVILMPKLLVSSVLGNTVKAGENAEIHITIKNTSRSEGISNLTVTAASQSEFLSLKSEADTQYFEGIGVDSEFEVIYTYGIRSDAPEGQYEIPLQFDYSYAKGMTGSGTATARLYVEQSSEIEFSPVVMPSEAVVSDTLEIPVQAINLGLTSVKNVRAVLEGDGLIPQGTAFLGEIAGNSEATQTFTVQITGKSGSEPYGKTSGRVTFYYTDQMGTEHSEVQEFSMMIKSPFVDLPEVKNETEPENWIWIMAVIWLVITVLTAYFVYRLRKRKNV